MEDRLEPVKKSVWAVQYNGPNGREIILSYSGHETQEDAIRAFEEQTGMTWQEAVGQGAALIQRDIFEFVRTRPTEE